MTAPADTRLAVLAREPVPGNGSTRLAAGLTATADATRLYVAMLGDLFANLAAVSGWTLPYLTGRSQLAFRAAAGWDGPLRWQTDGDLGSRILQPFDEAAADGARYVLVIGSDAPQVDAALVSEAAQELASARADLVLGPSYDGGYYLVGGRARRIGAALFTGVAWGTGEVLAQTCHRARMQGLRVAQLAPRGDIDTVGDLRRLLATNAAAACPRLAAVAAQLGVHPAAVAATSAAGYRRR